MERYVIFKKHKECSLLVNNFFTWSIFCLQECPELKLSSHGRKMAKFWRPAPDIEGLLAASGLSPLITCSLDIGNRGLMSAFMERWHKETSNFHFAHRRGDYHLGWRRAIATSACCRGVPQLRATSCWRCCRYVGGITRGQRCRGESWDNSVAWLLCSNIVVAQHVWDEDRGMSLDRSSMSVFVASAWMHTFC